MKPTYTCKRSLKRDPLFIKRIVLSLFAIFIGFASLKAQHINIEFSPSTTNTTPGGNFTVIVKASFLSTNPLNAIETHFTFDITKLQAASITNLSAATLPTIAISPSFNNVSGTVDFAAGTASNFPTADFNLYSVTFNVLPGATSGSTPLAFNTATTAAAGPGGVDILNSTINGTVIINAVGCTPPSATIRAAATCDASAFNLILATTPAPVGTAPFDLTINGTTYNDVFPGGTITNFAPPSQKIWPATPAPLPPTNEDNSITLGVRFQSSVSGFVKGVRFFAPDEVPVTAGTFTGQLWTSTGTLLASGTFTGVTVDSWNELIFSDPVLITAGTDYVASYHTNAIKYVGTPGGLAAPVVNGPLTALSGGGVFIYGAAVAFPATGSNNNYWADVIFSANNYTFNLTSIKDALECTSTGSPNLQTLSVTSNECGTLPVSLISFSATPQDNSVMLRWSTASELNNLGFEIQRSIDGNAGWTTLGFVNGAGNSTTTLHYSYLDESLQANRYYYRLKQIDIDQRFAYSPIVTAVLDAKRSFQLEQNFPNPFKNETVIRFSLPQRAKVNLSLFDMNGKLIKVMLNESRESGTHAVTLNSGVLTSGVYYYKLQAGEFSAVKKMTIQ